MAHCDDTQQPRENAQPNSDVRPEAGAELEGLISRVVDGTATRAHWKRIESLAGTDQTTWRLLALSQRDHTMLVREVAHATHAAEQVDLPSSPSVDLDDAAAFARGGGWGEGRYAARGDARGAGASVGSLGVRSWGGWAAAAVLTLALVVQGSRTGTALSGGLATNSNQRGGSSGQTAGLFGSAADVLNAYLQRGHDEGSVLGEVPEKVLVQSRPVEQGNGYEVIYVRQIVERAKVPDLYRFSQDERGQALPVRVRVGFPARTTTGPM